MKKMTDNDFELFICRNEKKSERRELLKRVLLAYGIKKKNYHGLLYAGQIWASLILRVWRYISI